MMYGHEHFIIDPAKQEVKDRNRKVLRITGAPYRLLEFLCQKHSAGATISDINLALDPAEAREITEDYVRRMKNQIHAIIGQNVIKYENHVYSMIGEVIRINGNAIEGHKLIQGPMPLPAMRGMFRIVSWEENAPHSLRVVSETPGGGQVIYQNDNYQGIW